MSEPSSAAAETDAPQTPTGIPVAQPVPEPSKPQPPNSVYLVSYPKIVFLYPTVIVSFLCALFLWIRGGIPLDAIAPDVPPAAVSAPAENAPADVAAPAPAVGHTYQYWCARIFLAVLGFNLVVISFEFPRTTSLTWFFAISTLCLAGWFLFSLYDNLAPTLLQGVLAIKPMANGSFYMIFTTIMLVLFVAVLISRRVDYWEVRGNELLHHHGFLSNLERFNAPNLRIDKEITDLFEYLLLRSGRLVIHCSNERRAIVLENVLGIDKKERQITQMLGALQVRVRTDKEEE
ncbi:MAG: hypothetical protein ACKO2P_18950 [Planctomycetota bacterium]